MDTERVLEKTIRTFLKDTIPDMISKDFDLKYIKFVFPDKALNEMEAYNEKTTDYLRKVKYQYENGLGAKEDIFIKVDDYRKFFFLLTELIDTYGNTSHRPLICKDNFIRSIWLRMSPSDINNVNEFLRQQLIFLFNADFIPYYIDVYKEIDGIPVYFSNDTNNDWFESNNCVKFFFQRKEDNSDPEEYYYELPSIHYGITQENKKNVCYIYGIQKINEKDNSNDEVLKKQIHNIRKPLCNKYVSPDFVLALELFIEYLHDRGITQIKVPLLQVYNYTFHKHFSTRYKREYNLYKKDIDKLEKELKGFTKSKRALRYITVKEQYQRFADKEDLISKNKTERLLQIFMLVSEKFDSIEFLSDPFIEGDSLLIKIKDKNKKIK